MASLVFLCFFSSCQVVSLFLFVFLGARKKVDQCCCCWRVACLGVLCFCCSFLARGGALVFLFTSSSCHGVSFFLSCFLGVKKKWISASGTVFGASFGLHAIVFCGFVFHDLNARWLPCFFFIISLPAKVFPCFWLCFWEHGKSWISVAGVLSSMVFYVFVVAFWQVVVLSFFCLFHCPAMVFPFF